MYSCSSSWSDGASLVLNSMERAPAATHHSPAAGGPCSHHLLLGLLSGRVARPATVTAGCRCRVGEFAQRRSGTSLAYQRLARPPPRRPRNHTRRPHERRGRRRGHREQLSMADWAADSDDEMEGAPLPPLCAYWLGEAHPTPCTVPRAAHTRRPPQRPRSRWPSRSRPASVSEHSRIACRALCHRYPFNIPFDEHTPFADDEAVGDDGY